MTSPTGRRDRMTGQNTAVEHSQQSIRVGVLCPMKPELAPLVKVLSLQPEQRGDLRVHTGRIDDIEVVATITGIGTRPATEATERLLDAVEPDHVLVVGVAGGISPHTKIGDLVVPAVVFDGDTGTEYRPAPLGDTRHAGTIRTSDDFICDNTLLADLAGRGVVAVDMETASVAAVCEERGVPWTAFRAISDMATDDDASDALLSLAKPDGSANIPGVIRYLAFKPWRIRQLSRLAQGAKIATRAAADAAVAACRQHDFGTAPTREEA
jgi:adenosylhomocysteine nucleosidase